MGEFPITEIATESATGMHGSSALVGRWPVRSWFARTASNYVG